MDITVLYNKKKYLIQNLFHAQTNQKAIQVNHQNLPIPQSQNNCFFLPVEGSKRFFKVQKIKNVVKKEEGQSLFGRIFFNTQNSLSKKKIQCELDYPGKSFRKSSLENTSLRVFSPLTGQVITILKKEGPVDKDECILVIDAMKMENKILAPKKGTLVLGNIKENVSVKTGDLLFQIDP